MATKRIILDSSVLLFEHHLLRTAGESSLVVPFAVLDELRHSKSTRNSEGRAAREFFSLFAQLREEGRVGTALDAPVVVWRESSRRLGEQGKGFSDRGSDSAVIVTARELHALGEEVEIYTRDTILLMMADAFGIKATFYEGQTFRAEELYPGYRRLVVDGNLVQEVKERRAIALDGDFYPNEYLYLVEADGERRAHCRYDAAQRALVPLLAAAEEVPRWITPRNREQSFALDALLNDEIRLVSLIGKAGTGKTLLALAAGLYKSLDCDEYERVLVSRPTLPLGQDIGYLPGSVEEKLGPWMHPIADNIDFILKRKNCGRPNMRSFSDLAEMDMVVIEPLAYIRGRSIHDQFLLVDEAQNLSLHEIRTIVTRAGEGTKIVLAGDPYQIDNPELTSRTSGLMQVVDRFCDETIAAHITLTIGERSNLAERAADLL